MKHSESIIESVLGEEKSVFLLLFLFGNLRYIFFRDVVYVYIRMLLVHIP